MPSRGQSCSARWAHWDRGPLVQDLGALFATCGQRRTDQHSGGATRTTALGQQPLYTAASA
eukprot:15476172-Alexandrium_andersonii.AAC.1